MPTVLLNSVLGLLPDRTVAVSSSDTLGMVIPMYNEEHGARRSLASVLRQERLPEQIFITVNGGTDGTYGVASRILGEYGYRLAAADQLQPVGARLEQWLGPAGVSVSLLEFSEQTAKSESVNQLFRLGLIRTDRLLVVDGDTILHPDFVLELHRNFYRLRRSRTGFILEDYALQSGAVNSWAPHGSRFQQRLISAGRQGEYAFSTVLRRGQSRLLGSSSVFGRSRLFTVTGCGFAARADQFPIPDDTQTEDHDFTLACQSTASSSYLTSSTALEKRGFLIEQDGELVAPSEFFAADERIEFRRSGSARYVPEAFMLTEDPLNLGGFLAQVERWNGGGQENALKRLGNRISPNTAFAVWSAQVEGLLGIILLLGLLPLLILLNLGNPSVGLPLRSVGFWFLGDVILSLLFNVAGFALQRRARGQSRSVVLLGAARSALLTLPAYLLIKYLNPFTWIASATTVLPAWLRNRKRTQQKRGVVWERVRQGRHRSRTQGVMLTLAVSYPLLVSWVIAPQLVPVNAQGWQLTNQRPVVHLENHAFSSPLFSSSEGGFCGADPAGSSLALSGSASDYLPLGEGDLLTLARLTPITVALTTAAAAYDVPVDLLIRVLINESSLNPLAEGPTGDLGLSQVTSDALTLLAAISNDPRSPQHNPRLISEQSDVFDPEFSACAGAAKLAWARNQRGVTNELEAYALYINPTHGFTDGVIGETWVPLTEALNRLASPVDRILNAHARHAEDPEAVTETERQLIELALAVQSEALTLREAYTETLRLVRAAGLADEEMYQLVIRRLYYGHLQAEGGPGTS